MTGSPRFRALLAVACPLFVAAPCLAESQGAPLSKAQKAQAKIDKKVDARVEKLLSALSQDEKLSLLSGTGFDTRAVSGAKIGGLHMTDGPLGVRGKPATAWPSGISTAATFEPSFAERIAGALAREAKAMGKNTVLGPCVNIQREPQGGRNFESYGEDPFLASRMAVAYVQGMQKERVAATVKHFALNNQETERATIDVRADERTMREIYLPQFEAAVVEAGAQSVMCSYNKLNGPWACENPWLLTDVLKRDWGFRGLVMSDWGATHSTTRALKAGLDLEMPGGQFLTAEAVKAALDSGALQQAAVDEAVRRQLRVQVALGWLDQPLDPGALDTPAHRLLNREAAAAGMVLLKNEGLLPLDRARLGSVAVIGPNATPARTGGGGSASVEPIYSVSPLDAVKAKLGEKVRVDYAPGAASPDDIKPIPASALRPPAGSAGDQGLLAEYFDNEALQGAPVLRRVEAVDFDWKNDGPAGLGRVDHFGVRWTGTLEAPEDGTYVIGITSDDGSFLWLDGQPFLENGGTHGMILRSRAVVLGKGERHSIRLEMTEGVGGAGMILGWLKVEQDPVVAAVSIAKAADVALVFVGSTASDESEGSDRERLQLPENQSQLVLAVAAANPKTVVVLDSGAPVLVEDWLEKTPALLETWFAGSETGNAIADVLFGDVNPAGKLPMTWPRRWQDASAYGNFPGRDGWVGYGEGVFVGYRHFDTQKIEPRFPFGFGLSYSTFALAKLEAKQLPNRPHAFEVSFDVKNTGTVPGAEVAQVYVRDVGSSVPRPLQELKGFRRVLLKPGETQRVKLVLDERAFSFFDASRQRWVVEPGDFEIRVGRSSRQIDLTQTLELN